MSALHIAEQPAPPLSSRMRHNLISGLQATMRRDQHRLSLLACPPGQTTPAARMLRQRIEDTKANLADLEAL